MLSIAALDVRFCRRHVRLRLFQLGRASASFLNSAESRSRDPFRVSIRRLRLAIRRDRRGEVGRRHVGERLSACHDRAGVRDDRVVAGPDTGDSTCVDLSPLNATLPVASTTGRNDTGLTVDQVNALPLFRASS